MKNKNERISSTQHCQKSKPVFSYSDSISRNKGIISETEQDILRRSTIGIAGVGGVGGLLAERLIRVGVGGLKITDPGTFELSNFNRQFGSSMETLAKNKAEVIYHQLKSINPEALILCDQIGISSQNDALSFCSGCDLIIDEMDFGMFSESIRLQRAARQGGIHYIFTSAIGFGTLLVIFEPDGFTLEEFNGLPSNVNLDGIEKLRVPIKRIMPITASYAPTRADQFLEDIYAGLKTIPTVSIGVGLASILAANEAVNIILRKRDIPVAPEYTYIDLIDRVFFVGDISPS